MRLETGLRPVAGHPVASSSRRAGFDSPPRRLPPPLRSIASLAGDLLTAVFPAQCLSCDCALPRFSRLPVCELCWMGLQPLLAEQDGVDLLCARCGDGLPFESRALEAASGVRHCARCRLALPMFARAVAYGAYDDAMRALIRSLKYDGVQELAAGRVGRMLAHAALRLRDELAEPTLVLPVPLSEKRLRDRGFNQSALLAESMRQAMRRQAKQWRLEVRRDVLVRVRDTTPLFGKTPEERQKLLRGVFRVADSARDALRGREVLLVDDVMTTGATADACARALLRAGVGKVCVVTLARRQQESAFQRLTGPHSVG